MSQPGWEPVQTLRILVMTASSWNGLVEFSCFISGTGDKSTCSCLSMKTFLSEQLKEDNENGYFAFGSGPDVIP